MWVLGILLAVRVHYRVFWFVSSVGIVETDAFFIALYT